MKTYTANVLNSAIVPPVDERTMDVGPLDGPFDSEIIIRLVRTRGGTKNILYRRVIF